MGATLLIVGGLLGLYFFSRPGSSIATVLSGATHGTVKLGNADPNFEPWLAGEMQKIFGQVTNSVPNTQEGFDLLETSIRNRRMGGVYNGVWTIGYWRSTPGDCGGSSSSGLFGTTRQIGVGIGLASQGADFANTAFGLAGAAESVANAVPIVGQIASVFTSIFSGIAAHHAQAVQLEQSTLCQAVPAFNAALDSIDQQYRLGQLSGPQAIQALETLYQQMNQGLAQIERPGKCNASCVYLRQLRGIIDAKTLFDY
ncbi:MAG TPA: hypothetical protein VKP58_08175 [Candidatus Acidoferrum sp.]|nr:hypothetical protein [Candidatus Acidoferrum sp.]